MLTTVDLGSLQTASTITLSKAVTTVDLHSLTHGDVAFTTGGSGVLSGNPTIDLPALVEGSIQVTTTGAVSAPNLLHSMPVAQAEPISITASSVNLQSLESASTLILKITGPVSLPALATMAFQPLATQHLLSITATGPLTLPLLTDVQADFAVSGVSSVSLPVLTRIDGSATFSTTGAVSAPQLTRVGQGTFVNGSVASLKLTGGISSFQAPLLTEIGKLLEGSLEVTGATFAVLDLPALKRIHNDLLLGTQCSSAPNPNLLQVNLPALMQFDTFGTFFVANNPLFPQCRIDALATKLHQSGWQLSSNPTLCNVQPTSPCP